MPKRKDHYHGDDYDSNSTYMFHNQKYEMSLFLNADGYEQAMMKFDLCDFPNRDEWKIFIQCGQQPTGDKNGR